MCTTCLYLFVTLGELLDSSSIQLLLSIRLCTMICPLPPLPPLSSHSSLLLFKNLPPNTAYCNPTPSSVLHWTKMLILDNLSSSSINSVQVASTLSNNTNLRLFFYWPPMLSTQNKTHKTIHAHTLLLYIH